MYIIFSPQLLFGSLWYHCSLIWIKRQCQIHIKWNSDVNVEIQLLPECGVPQGWVFITPHFINPTKEVVSLNWIDPAGSWLNPHCELQEPFAQRPSVVVIFFIRNSNLSSFRTFVGLYQSAVYLPYCLKWLKFRGTALGLRNSLPEETGWLTHWQPFMFLFENCFGFSYLYSKWDPYPSIFFHHLSCTETWEGRLPLGQVSSFSLEAITSTIQTHNYVLPWDPKTSLTKSIFNMFKVNLALSQEICCMFLTTPP